MCCLALLAGFLGPRVALLFWWILGDKVDAAFDSWYWPLLGLVFLGAADDSYPDAWLDPATGELPTLQQLAALDQISMPTLRKRRNEAIAKLQAAGAR